MTFLGIGLAAVGFLLFKGLKSGMKLMEAADNFRISLASLPKIHRIDLSGIKISADLKVDNPTKQALSIKIPSVALSYKGKAIANTAVNSKTYTIAPESSGKITDIMVECGLLNIISLVGSGIISDPQLSANIGFEALVEVNGIPIKVSKVA
jgi:hypothetical protein